MNASLAAGFLGALYLAVLFQTFKEPESEEKKGTPFGSGLEHPDRVLSKLLTVSLVVAVQVVTAVSAGFAIAKSSPPVVDSGLAFLFALVGIRQLLWVVEVANRDWWLRHARLVLNCAFLLPFGFWVLTMAILAATG